MLMHSMRIMYKRIVTVTWFLVSKFTFTYKICEYNMYLKTLKVELLLFSVSLELNPVNL